MGNEAFGIKFILTNDVQQILPKDIFVGGPWLHMATIVRGLKEYVCFKNTKRGTVYIEELDPKEPGYFKKIEDDEEFNDLRAFLEENGVLSLGTGREFKVAKQKK